MKTPKAHQLPSGAWHCRVRDFGNDISITNFDKKAAIAEAMAVQAKLFAERTKINRPDKNLTVYQAMDNYIAERENIVSPSTVRGYRCIQKNRFRSAHKLRVSEVSEQRWQRIVNEESTKCSAKTLRNAWRMLSASIYKATGQKIEVQLPQVVEKDLPFLTPEQIVVFIDAIKGESCEIPALLALTSLRRSEILALRWESIDLEKKMINISGSAVYGPDQQLVMKPTNKNRSSKRVIPLIRPLEDALQRTEHPKTGLVVTGNPNSIWVQVNRICRNNGLPEVGVHGLRRSFASLAYHLNLPEEVTMRIGGWSNAYTMRKIYTKLSQRDIAEQSAVFMAFFEGDN